MARITVDGSGTRTVLPYPPPYRPLATRVVSFDPGGGIGTTDFVRYGADGLPGAGGSNDDVDTTGFGDVVDPAGGVLRAERIRRRLQAIDPSGALASRVMIDEDSPDLAVPIALPDPNEIGALGSDDESPLRAILITVRFYDPASDQLREVSFRHNLIDP